MKNIFKILEGLGIEVPEDKKSTLEKEVHENYRTKKDYDDQVEKAESTQKLLDETADKLKKFDGVDVADLQEKLKETTETLENERADRKKKEEEAERHATAAAACQYTMPPEELEKRTFKISVNDEINIAELEKKLADDSAKGKSMDDLFNAMVKDSEGKDIPNILVSEQAEDDADNAAVFTEPMGNQTDTRIKGDPNNMDFETYKKWREQNS